MVKTPLIPSNGDVIEYVEAEKKEIQMAKQKNARKVTIRICVNLFLLIAKAITQEMKPNSTTGKILYNMYPA